MGNFDWSWFISISVGVAIAGVQMLVGDQWRKRLGWAFMASSLILVAMGVHGLLHGPSAVVTLFTELKARLGSPYPYQKAIDPYVYEGQYENALVIWIDGRFFQLGLDGQH